MKHIETGSLTLAPRSPEETRAALDALSPEHKREVSPAWLARVAAATSADPWIHGFALIHRPSGAVVGSAGFKAPPSQDGVVELAYVVEPEHQGKGYATEVAAALAAFAFSSPEVRVVRAHTLPESGASTRVLAKCGFQRIGEVHDPEDGRVWRWEISRSPILELKLSVELGSAAAKVWEVTGDFNGLPAWHPWVESSVLEPASGGVGRRVTNVGGTAGRRELTERLVHFDAEAREYAYTIIAGPAPFVDYVGRFRVLPLAPDRCVFEFVARFRAAPGRTDAEAKERIRTFYEAGLANLPRMFGS